MSWDFLLAFFNKFTNFDSLSSNFGVDGEYFIISCIFYFQRALESKNDQHGRNSTLLTYVAYLCTIPHPSDTPPSLSLPLPPKHPAPPCVAPSVPQGPTSPTHSTKSGGSSSTSSGAVISGSMASVTSVGSSSSYVGPMINESPIGIGAPVGELGMGKGGSAHTLHPSGLMGVPLQPSHRR